MRNNFDCHTIDQNSFFSSKFWTMFYSTVGQPQPLEVKQTTPLLGDIIYVLKIVGSSHRKPHTHTNHFCIRSEDLGMRFFFCKEFQSNVHQCRHYPSLEMSKFQLTFQYVSYLWFIREESFSWFRFRDPRITSAIDW